MNGPGTFIFARDDASAPRQPSLYSVESSYVTEAKSAAASAQTTITAITAGLAIALIWLAGRMK